MQSGLLGRSFVLSGPLIAGVAGAGAAYLPLASESAIAAAVLVGAVAVTFSALPTSHGRSAVAYIVLTCLVGTGIILGSLSSQRRDAIATLPPPMLDGAVGSGTAVTVTVRALSDGAPTSSGRYRLPVRVLKAGPAESANGVLFQSWRGRGTLVYRNGREPVYWGDLLDAEVRVWCPETSADCVIEADTVRKVDAGLYGPGAPLLLGARKTLRHTTEQVLEQLPGDVRGLTGALVLGDRSSVPERVLRGFRMAGLSHLLALSGMHLAVVAGSIMLLMDRRFGRLPGVLSGVVTAWGYVWMVGPGPSLLRAAIMLTLWGLGRIRHRPMAPRNSLGFGFLLLCLVWPSIIGDLSFLFSFLALAGILLMGVPLGRALQRWIPPILAIPLGVSSGAFMATMPLSLAAFGYAAPAGALLSVVAGPLVVALVWAGILLLIAGGFGLLLLPAYWAATILGTLLLAVVRAGAGLPVVTAGWVGDLAWLIGTIPAVCFAAFFLARAADTERRRRRIAGEELLV